MPEHVASCHSRFQQCHATTRSDFRYTKNHLVIVFDPFERFGVREEISVPVADRNLKNLAFF